MHITLEADYAIRIVAHLAKEQKRCDANSISEATGVSLRFSLKILRNLVIANIVKSFKGATGGYELNIECQKITLKQILESIEGEYVFCRCLSKDADSCTNPDSSPCKVQKVFYEISNIVKDKLESTTIADLI